MKSLVLGGSYKGGHEYECIEEAFSGDLKCWGGGGGGGASRDDRIAGADPGFQVRGGGGAHLKKIRRAEGGAKIFGVFLEKNHDFTPKKSYFSNFRGGARNFWGISCERARFYAKKIIFFPILGGARAGCAPPPPPESAPG